VGSECQIRSTSLSNTSHHVAPGRNDPRFDKVAVETIEFTQWIRPLVFSRDFLVLHYLLDYF